MAKLSEISIVDVLRIRLSPIARSIVSIVKVPTWVLQDRPHPSPPHVKRRTIVAHANKQKFESFVETGTYRGDMLQRISRKTSVKEILSIELDGRLAKEAQFRFQNNPKIEILHGDSGSVLESLMSRLPEPTLFWLDGHYSGGVTALGTTTTPIFEELQAIDSSKRSSDVILIDDIRLFNGTDGYPPLEQLIEFIQDLNPKWNCQVVGDFLQVS
jgi:hypothetical protein